MERFDSFVSKASYEAYIVYNDLLLLLTSIDNYGSNKIECYTNRLEKKWVIDNETNHCPFVGISIQDNIVYVVDFCGVRYRVDIINGKIKKNDIVK